MEYPEIYLEKLEELIHPHMYLTCFSASGTNSSMWGNYAENHSGICLVYETEPREGKEWFPVKLPYAYHNDGTVETKFVEREFRPVKYENEVIESNFFKMLGTLTGKELGSWLIDKNGMRSCCMESIYVDKEAWRNQYWKCLEDRYCCKMKDWSHEEEYRLLLPDTFGEFQEFEKRCIPYDLKSLKGLIFGLKVPQERKYQTMQMVRKLCESVQKEDFVFYQVEYDVEQRRINIREMGW